MFKIDLLKGQGIPVRSRPESIAIAAVALVVPVVIIFLMLGCFLQNRIIISINKSRIAQYEEKITDFAGAVQLQQNFESEKKQIEDYLEEIGSSLSLGLHKQWTPVLVTVVENIPDSVVLTELEVKKSAVKKKVPKKTDPEKTVSIDVPVRTLRMSVKGSATSDCDQKIKEFREKLYASDSLGSMLENIMVSRKMDVLQQENEISYQIDCVFKPGL
jgi:Tfp pilus assembly protein PilN